MNLTNFYHMSNFMSKCKDKLKPCRPYILSILCILGFVWTMEKLLLMKILLVFAVGTTIHSLRYEAWKRKPFLRNRLLSLCGISFIKIYKLCCDKPEKCRFKNKLTMGYSNDIGASDKETFLKWIKDDINTINGKKLLSF